MSAKNYKVAFLNVSEILFKIRAIYDKCCIAEMDLSQKHKTKNNAAATLLRLHNNTTTHWSVIFMGLVY